MVTNVDATNRLAVTEYSALGNDCGTSAGRTRAGVAVLVTVVEGCSSGRFAEYNNFKDVMIPPLTAAPGAVRHW